MSKTKTFVYTGCDTLEAVAEAVNYNAFLVDLILREVDVKKTKRILDFGAGMGTYAAMLKERGIKVECLEPDKKLQSKLRENGFRVYASTKELKANSFDLIFSLNVFEHIENDFAEIQKLQTAIKKGGRLLIYVPAYQVLYSTLDKKVEHFRRYRTKRLKQLADASRLRIVELCYFDPLGFGAALVYKLGRGDGTLKPGPVKLYDKLAFPLSKRLHPLSKKLFGKNALLVAEKVK